MDAVLYAREVTQALLEPERQMQAQIEDNRRLAREREHARIERERRLQAQHPPVIPPPQRFVLPTQHPAMIVSPVGQFQQPGAVTPTMPRLPPPQQPLPWERRHGACATFDNDMGAMSGTLKPWSCCAGCVGCGGLIGTEVADLRCDSLMQTRLVAHVMNRQSGLQHDAAIGFIRAWLDRMQHLFSPDDFTRER